MKRAQGRSGEARSVTRKTVEEVKVKANESESMQVKVNESESKISIKVFLPLRNSRVYVAICNVLEHLKIPVTTR